MCLKLVDKKLHTVNSVRKRRRFGFCLEGFYTCRNIIWTTLHDKVAGGHYEAKLNKLWLPCMEYCFGAFCGFMLAYCPCMPELIPLFIPEPIIGSPAFVCVEPHTVATTDTEGCWLVGCQSTVESLRKDIKTLSAWSSAIEDEEPALNWRSARFNLS